MRASRLSTAALFFTLAACDVGLELGTGASAAASCRTPALAIHTIQGVEAESALAGEIVSVEGAVTAHRDRDDGSSGFFMQAITPDDDPRSSEGLFVATGPEPLPPAIGHRVRARGEVRELEGMTQLHAIELVQECGEAAPSPTRVSLADRVPSSLDGMWVRMEETWTLIDTWRVARDGELSLSRRGRLYAPGHQLGARAELPAEPPWLLEDAGIQTSLNERGGRVPRLRVGDELRRPLGVVRFAGGRPGLLATEPLDWREPAIPSVRARPADALRLVSLNLGNYFVRLGSRGAASEEELYRQRAKLVATLVSLDADLAALTELENDGDVSVQHLLAPLNEQLRPEQRYTWSRVTPPSSSTLRAALIYRPARVRALDEARFNLPGPFTRPPLVQRFEGDRGAFTLVVVHLKSKRCDGAPAVLGPEGCNAETRLAEATALAGSMGSLSNAPASEVLLMGDFNSDSLEAPMLELRRAGYVDLLDAIADEDRYSYVFEGRASLLDHALATAGMATALRSASVWNINADEPSFRSYHLDNPPEQYHPDPFRCSDHDPIVLDLAL
jgi:predicted extracellular nuclease